MAEKQKKPMFKRWWFWVIAVIVVFAIVGGGDKDSPKESVNVDNPEQVEQTKDEPKEEAKEEPKEEPKEEAEEDDVPREYKKCFKSRTELC